MTLDFDPPLPAVFLGSGALHLVQVGQISEHSASLGSPFP